MSYEYDVREKRDNKNLYCTPEEIDLRQGVELISILNRWIDGSTYPVDIVADIEDVFGIIAGPSLEYRHKKDDTSDKIAEHKEKLEQEMRPETLEHTEDIVNTLNDIQQKIQNADMTSWEAGIACAEILFGEVSDDFFVSFNNPTQKIKSNIIREKTRIEGSVERPEETLKFFRPETEEDIKKQCNIPEILSQINYPDRKLCNQIEIDASGTTTVDFAKRGGWEEMIPSARITSYSISFIPTQKEDLELLKTILEKSFKVLDEISYKDEEGEYWDGSYGRSGQRSGKKREDCNISIDGNKLILLDRFDLDDLWVLYYLIEPVIEPSSQIAAAMNAARYTEERGSPLLPELTDDFCTKHTAATFGSLADSDAETTLTTAMRDAVFDLALNEINEASFMARVSTLAAQTLSGRISDPLGVFPTYDKLLASQRSEGSQIITRDVAFKNRAKQIVSTIIGLKEDSEMPLHTALTGFIRQFKGPLREAFRKKAELDKREELQRGEERWNRMHPSVEQSEKEWDKQRNDLRKEIEGQEFHEDFLRYLTNELTGRSDLSEEDAVKARKNAVALHSNLVITDSEVETCIDASHFNGTYQSKMKGSPFVRKELPEKLKPFTQQHDNRYSSVDVRQLASPEIILS